MKNHMLRTILPANELTDNEVYAPGFKDGDILVLKDNAITLVVNNSNPDVYERYYATNDIIAINRNVADILGADFDGDMVKVSVKPNYKHFLKKVGIISGAVGGTALTLYFLNRSELGYKAKYAIIKKLGDSIIIDNHRYFFSHYVGDGTHITADHIHAVGEAICAVINPIAESVNLPPLTGA